MRAFRLLLTILALTTGTAILGADTVVLVNGDRLTGTVRRLEEGLLVLKSKYLGVVNLKWADIRSIATDASFTILTADGKRHDGQLTRDEARIRVSQEGSPDLNLPSASIARVVRGERTKGTRKIVSALEGSADIGYSLARGNQNQTQSSLGATAGYASARYRFLGRLDSLFARQDGARSQSRHALNARLDRFVNARLFAYGLSGLERNERRRLDLRSRFGGGIGWRLRDRNETRVSALGGFAYIHERFRHQSNRVAGEAFLGLEWRTKLFKAVEFDMALTVHSNQMDRRRARVEYDGTLRVPIAGPFSYSLRLFDRYDTRPAATVGRNDYGIVSALGVAF